MKIVIDITKEMYQHIQSRFMFQSGDEPYLSVLEKACITIKNGTPLSQSFDLEGLKSDMKALNCGYPYGLDYLLGCLKKRLGITLIEADTESEDKYGRAG